MTKLSVNVNKIATLRNARGKNSPNVLQVTQDIISYGAEGITVHPRPDNRHIMREDVYAISEHIDVEFNIEGYPSESFVGMVKEVKPAQCTLVPDPPDVITSNAGWQITNQVSFLKEVVQELSQEDIRVSLFVDPLELTEKDMDNLQEIRTDRVELYTEVYADTFNTPKHAEVVGRYQRVAQELTTRGLGLNAGHDLNLENLSLLIKTIPEIQEVSIGHALICDALYYGLEKTVGSYLSCLSPDRQSI